MRIAARGRDVLLTYCTNVHPVDDAAGLIASLDTTTAAVAAAVSPRAPFGVGLRLGEEQARALLDDPALLAQMEQTLARRNLFPFTINGFPQGRFQARRVKHAVYLPDWADPARASYTLALATLLARWLPADDRFGTISTLPIAWRADADARVPPAARALHALAADLARLEASSGARIMVCLEPEPGCVLETTDDAVAFFERHLLGGPDDAVVRRHLGVCYDACHQAVLFQEDERSLRRLAGAGISVGKVQISSALRLSFDRPGALAPLLACDEERFLHQVAVTTPGGAARRYDDLGDLGGAVSRGDLDGPGEARCHFHVPIHAEAFPPLLTTRGALEGAIAAALRHSDVRHFEVETYTFHVLPGALRAAPLEAQLIAEIGFAKSRLTA
jgi:sugar phosphate isomerase/epimerase